MFELRIDFTPIARISNLMAAAGKKMPDAIRRAVNHTGDKAKTQVIRALTSQTGLKRDVIVRAVKVTRANYGSLSYVMKTRGGDISLKYFGARETQSGVTARPHNASTAYAGAFLKGGRAPNRVPLKLGGHVFKRAGSSRTPIVKVKSGVYIPEEMVTGQTAAAFDATVNTALPDRLAHELERVIGG